MNDVNLKPVEMSLHILNINVLKRREKESGGKVLAANELNSTSRTVLFCGGQM